MNTSAISPYRFIEFDFQTGSNLPGEATLQAIQQGLIDGIVLRHIHPAAAAGSIAARFKEIWRQETYKSLYFESTFGGVFGPTLMESDMEAYLNRAALAKKAFETAFEGAFEQQVFNILAKMSPGTPLQIGRWKASRSFWKRLFEQPRSLSLASMRILHPGMSSLQAHIHQEFPTLFPSYEAIVSQSEMNTELSWYWVLQAADAGGELTLYNLDWDHTPPEFLKPEYFLSGVREDMLEPYGSSTIRLGTGDMVVFAANRIWHKISGVAPESKKERITIGGFLTKKTNENAQMLWI
jgi:hypothetical protein